MCGLGRCSTLAESLSFDLGEPVLILTFALTAAAAEQGCTPAHLQHCAAHLGRLTNDDPMAAYQEARAAAEGLSKAERVFSASELGEFYGAAAVVASRARTSKVARQASDPPDTQLESDAQSWASTRCRVGQNAPWPIFVGALEREVLDAKCVAEPSVSLVAPRAIWVDGTLVAANQPVEVAAGTHVVQYVEGGAVTTAVVAVDATTQDFGLVGVKERATATKGSSNPARWPLAIGGTALIGLGATGLMIWGSKLTPSLEENADQEVLISALSLVSIGLGTAGVFGGVLLNSSGPAVGVTVPL